MSELRASVSRVSSFVDRVAALAAAYHAGEIHAHVPEALGDSARTLG